MFTYLSNFFKSHRDSYSYPVNFEKVKNHIESVLLDDSSLWSTKDVKGNFLNNETFNLRLISVAYTTNLALASRFTGRIQQISETLTRIDIEIKSSILQYLLFFIFLASGITISISGLINYNLEKIIIGIIFSFIGPGICIWLGRIFNLTLKDRYLLYINQPLLD